MTSLRSRIVPHAVGALALVACGVEANDLFNSDSEALFENGEKNDDGHG